MALAASTIDEGVPGLEGTHTYKSFVLQNYHALRMPCARVRKITGLHGRPDSEDNREALRGVDGERVLPSRLRGKTVIYEGVIQGRTLPELRELSAWMRACFGATTTEDWMHVATPRGGVSWYAAMRPIDLSMDDEQTMGMTAQPSPWQRPFTLTMRQGKPYWMADPPQHDVTVADGATIQRFNEGTFPAEPIISLHGPGGGFTTVQRTGPDPRMLKFYGLDEIPGITTVSIDFGARTMFTNTGVDAANKLVTIDSNWWDDGVAGLLVGENNIKVSGCTWDLYYRHASI